MASTELRTEYLTWSECRFFGEPWRHFKEYFYKHLYDRPLPSFLSSNSSFLTRPHMRKRLEHGSAFPCYLTGLSMFLFMSLISIHAIKTTRQRRHVNISSYYVELDYLNCRQFISSLVKIKFIYPKKCLPTSSLYG